VGSEGGAGRSPNRWAAWVLPAAWASFAWLWVVIFSQVAALSYYVAVRGGGIGQYPSAMVVISAPVDRLLFLGLGVAVLAAHSGLLRYKGGSDGVAALASVGLAAGLAGYFFVNPLFVVLVGVAFVGVVAEGSSRLASAAATVPRVLLTAFLAFAVAILAAVAIGSAARWVAGGFDGSVPLGGQSWALAVGASQVLGLVYPVLPELVLLFFFSWALRLALAPELHPRLWPNDRPGEGPGDDEPRRWTRGRWPLVLLAAGVALAVFVGVYPYLPAVNPSSTLVGVDVRNCYLYWLKSIPGSHVCGPAGFYIGNERYGALWLLEGLAVASGSVGDGLKLAPAVWGSLLVVSTFILVKEGTGDGFLAGVSALLTGASMQLVAGIDAGILANWLGLSFAYLFFATVLRGMRKKRVWYLLPAFALFASLLFIHPWTWAVVLFVLAAYLAVDLMQSGFAHRSGSKKFGLLLVVSLLALGLGVDLVRSFLPSGSGLVVAAETVFPSLNPAHIPQVAPNLEQSLVQYLGGAQADPLWYALGVAGVIAVPTLTGRFGKLLVVWLGAISIGVLVVAPPTNLLQSRMVYDAPITILAALGLVAILDFVRSGFGSLGGRGERASDLTAVLLVVVVVGLALGFALDYVGFLYY
jgi:hypothetical protein